LKSIETSISSMNTLMGTVRPDPAIHDYVSWGSGVDKSTSSSLDDAVFEA
jgi:hypothetical protein